MMAEDSGETGFSADESDSFSHDSREEQNASYIKPAFCTEENEDYLNDSYASKSLPMSGYPCEVDQRPRASKKMKPRTHKRLRFVSEQGDPCYAWTSSNEMLNLLPRQQRRTYCRQHQKEEEAVITIQSAWRGWQVRKEIDEMHRAATQIQAAFRGYMTRKELPLGLCSGYQIDRPPSKKKSARTKSRSLALSNHVHHLDLATVPQTESQRMFLPNNRLKICPKYITEGFPLLDPNMSFFQVKSAIRPNREVFTYTSLNVLASRGLKQKYQNAATTIQAAWRKYQIRQKVKPMIQAVKSLNVFPSNFIINQASWKREWAGRTVEQHEIQQIIAKSTLRTVPQIRNINIYTMVKGMPASSQKPDISIKVQSTKAVVQGFQRDMRRGAQALYTVKSRHASKPSQILIHVDLQKGKDLPTKMEEMQKPEGC